MYANVVSMDEDDVWDRYRNRVDGVMVESFATDWSDGDRPHAKWEARNNTRDLIHHTGALLLCTSLLKNS